MKRRLREGAPFCCPAFLRIRCGFRAAWTVICGADRKESNDFLVKSKIVCKLFQVKIVKA